MRNIKFRAWSKKFNKFMSIGFHIIGETTLFDLLNQHTLEEMETLEITECTGLKDKNDKDVYEGDIVKFENEFTAEIIWCEENAAFQIRSEKGGGAFLNELYMLNFEVVGNVFENADLLKKI